ncbi:MAG TPA: dTDP-4-amino-4,6-dideoxygalactose transaminase [Candidatus Elarobacter sp.]|nr:dTDP-4-amino-4,6-dideoxygalactose transaminase [Dongiaceae bacterium]HZW54142.1 dTDP-4-amino-4,6-dideoxygalactose transaminase [Candidatus Elarobacter sp.]
MIPFNKPHETGDELRYITEAIAAAHLSGDGRFSRLAQEWLERETHAARALLTHSCTAALEMAALLANAGPGDEIIMPSYTFVSTANAFVLRGATPVFVDVRPDTLNLDEQLVAEAITPRTRAIAAVHYAGVACEMDALVALAREHGLLLVEDAAQALGATYRGRPLGTMGELGALSFHETKNVISGEGGALLVRDDGDFAERAEILREKGTNRTNFLRGRVDKYRWVDVGSSFLPSEIVAAFLWGQLQHAHELLLRRLLIWEGYHERFAGLEAAGFVTRPTVPDHVTHNGHMYYLLLPTARERQAVLERLRAFGVHALFHYVPLHSAPAGRRYGRVHGGELPVTDDVSARLIRLPMHYDLSGSDLDAVASAVGAALGKRVAA